MISNKRKEENHGRKSNKRKKERYAGTAVFSAPLCGSHCRYLCGGLYGGRGQKSGAADCFHCGNLCRLDTLAGA